MNLSDIRFPRQAHAPRLLGCLLDIDGCALGNLLTGKDMQIKHVMAEH